MENFRTIVDQVVRIIESERVKYHPGHMTLSETQKCIYEKLFILEKQLNVFGDVAKNELKKELIRDNDRYLKDSIKTFSELQEKSQGHSYQREIDHKFKFSVHAKVAAIIIEYLEETPKSQTSKELQPQPISKKQNRTKKVIAEQFELLDKKGWQYAFKNETDYDIFVDLLTNFFEFREYKIPYEIIPLNKGCKTRLAGALGNIHSKLTNNDTLSGDDKFFDIVKVLSHYSELTKTQLYKDLTRFGSD